MKNFLIVILFAVLCLFGYLYWEKRNDEKESLQQNTALIQEQIRNVGKLVVTEGTFSQVFTYKNSKSFYFDVLSARKKALIIVNADVSVAYDLSKLDIEIDEENKRVIIHSIPEEEIKINPNIKYYDVTQDYLNQFEAEDYNKIKSRVEKGLREKIEKSRLKTNAKNRLISELQKIYIQTTGKTALSYREKELVGHGTSSHAEGFGSPIGKLKGINLAIEDMSPRDLRAYAIYEGERVCLEFEGGIKVEGSIITGTRNLQGKIIIISFEDCTVTHGDEILFQPDWGRYDMAVGKEIISAFAGPADHYSFDLITHNPSSTTIKSQLTPEREELESLYKAVSNIRHGENTKFSLNAAFDILKKHHKNDWLLAIEIYELAVDHDQSLADEVKAYLLELTKRRPEISHLIEDGIEMTETKLVSP